MKEYDYTWTTATGKKIHINDMTESHAKNCLKLIFRRNQMQDNRGKKLITALHDIQCKHHPLQEDRYGDIIDLHNSTILDRIWDEGKQEEEDEQGSWSEHCRDESYKYNHETGLFDIT